MTTSSPPNSDEENKKSVDPVRIDLARLRKQAGLSLDDMSKRLKLNRDLLQRLERGETEFLGAPAYIRGYLKNYAKVLGVPEREIMAGYPVPAEKQPRINTQYAIANVAPRRRSSGHFLGYLLGTLVVAAFAYGIWHMMSQGHAGNSTGLGVEIGSLAESEGNNDNTVKTTSEGDFHYSSLLPPPPVTSRASTNEENLDNGSATENPQQDKSMDDEMAPKQATDESEPQTTAVAIPEQSGQTKANAVVSPASMDTARAEVIVQVNEPAWVSLRQADGTRLEHNLLSAGEYRYTASLPVHFRLGNAQQVQVWVNGQLLPMTDRIRKDVADFDWPASPEHVATN